jgi:uncharacterized delta-60 repeat protein
MLEGRLLLNAGDLDTTFDGDGYVSLSTPGHISLDTAAAVKVQPNDGKILVAGDVFNDRGKGRQFQVVRLNADGSLDDGSLSDSTPGDSFGSGGRVLPRYGNLYDMALQQNGRILLAGIAEVTTGSGKNKVTHYDVALVRLLANGMLDASFGQGGNVTTGISTSSGTNSLDDYAHAITVQPDGKILVGGEAWGGSASGFDTFLVRYNIDGSLDPDFGPKHDGKVVTAWSSPADCITDIAIQDNGKIVVAGKGYLSDASHGYPYYVARYNADGSLDPSFGTAGTGAAITPFGDSSDPRLSVAHALAQQPDGSLVFTMRDYNGVDYDYDIALARFTPSGVIDSSTFGNGAGFVTVPLAGKQIPWSVAVQADGKLVVVGGNNYNPDPQFVARFHPNGDLDTGFGNGGLVRGPSQGQFYDVAIQSDGKIIAAGPALVGGNNDILVARFMGGSGSSPAAASPSAPSSPTAISPIDQAILAPLDPSTDLGLTQLAIEWLRSTPKRGRPALRAPSRLGDR